jgi:acetolactate decarboxylase
VPNDHAALIGDGMLAPHGVITTGGINRVIFSKHRSLSLEHGKQSLRFRLRFSSNAVATYGKTTWRRAMSIMIYRNANLEAIVPASLKAALDSEVERTSTSISTVVTAALSRYLGHQLHTLFQVSTSGALVAGVSDGEVTVKSILEHGDFGIGTFADLDGEMVVLDGRVYRVQGSGRVSESALDASAPFAVVTRFSPQTTVELGAVANFMDLAQHCDKFRDSSNIFYAMRLDGRFRRVRTRAVNPQARGTRLVDAAKAQSEFQFADAEGTLVGLWSPGFSSAFSVPGYHFHFISADRKQGGHLLDLDASDLRLNVEALTDFHLALPESEAFLKADLSKSGDNELAYAEQAH